MPGMVLALMVTTTTDARQISVPSPHPCVKCLLSLPHVLRPRFHLLLGLPGRFALVLGFRVRHALAVLLGNGHSAFWRAPRLEWPSRNELRTARLALFRL